MRPLAAATALLAVAALAGCSSAPTPSTPSHTTPARASLTASPSPATTTTPLSTTAITRYLTLPTLPTGWIPVPPRDPDTRDFTGAIWHYAAPGTKAPVCELRVISQGGLSDDLRAHQKADELRALSIPGTKVLRNELTTATPTVHRFETSNQTASNGPQHMWSWKRLSPGGTMSVVVGNSLDAYENRCQVKTLVDAVHWTGTEHPGP